MVFFMLREQSVHKGVVLEGKTSISAWLFRATARESLAAFLFCGGMVPSLNMALGVEL